MTTNTNTPTLSELLALENPSETLSSLNKTQLTELLTTSITLIQTPRDNRKSEVLRLITERPHTIQELADALNTTTKNISSQLSYLRKDNHTIMNDPLGRKFVPTTEQLAILFPVK